MIESLKGRLLYAAGHTHGRCTQLACQLLHKFSGDGPLVLLTVELIHAVAMALEQLMNSRPREVMPWWQQQSVLLFTDGAVEDDFGSVTNGALLVDMSVGNRFYFGGHIPSSLVDDWRAKGNKQVVAQAEIFPILVSKETRADVISQRSLLWFTDNEAARMALIRNYSPVIDNFLLLQVNSQLDLRVEARHWYIGCALRVILQMLQHVCHLSNTTMLLGVSRCFSFAWTASCNSRSLRSCWKGEVSKLPMLHLVRRSTQCYLGGWMSSTRDECITFG